MYSNKLSSMLLKVTLFKFLHSLKSSPPSSIKVVGKVTVSRCSIYDYSEITAIDGINANHITNTVSSLPLNTTPIDITYSAGTLDIIANLQTINVLLSVIIAFLFIITFFVSYYVIMTRLGMGGRRWIIQCSTKHYLKLSICLLNLVLWETYL